MAFSTRGWSRRFGHLGVEGLGVDLQGDGEAVAEARPLDLEIAVEEAQLLLQAHLLRPHALEGVAQQVAQKGQHAVGRPQVLVHEGRDGVQGVEEEVGMQLQAQDLELRLGEARLELGPAQGLVAGIAGVVDRVTHEDDVPIVDQGPDPGGDEARRR